MSGTPTPSHQPASRPRSTASPSAARSPASRSARSASAGRCSPSRLQTHLRRRRARPRNSDREGARDPLPETCLSSTLAATHLPSPPTDLPTQFGFDLVLATGGRSMNILGGLPIVADGYLVGAVGGSSGEADQGLADRGMLPRRAGRGMASGQAALSRDGRRRRPLATADSHAPEWARGRAPRPDRNARTRQRGAPAAAAAASGASTLPRCSTDRRRGGRSFRRR